MKNSILIALASLALIGCAGETDKDTGGDSATGSETGTTDTNVEVNPPEINFVFDYKCGENGAAAGEVAVGVETKYWTSGDGLFFWGDFANATPFSEQHSLISVDFASDGSSDTLARILTADAAFADFTPDSNTLLSCGSHLGGAEDTVTSLSTVYDLDGSFADCVALGPDAQGLLDGDFAPYTNDPTNPNEWAGCRVGR